MQCRLLPREMSVQLIVGMKVRMVARIFLFNESKITQDLKTYATVGLEFDFGWGRPFYSRLTCLKCSFCWKGKYGDGIEDGRV